MAPRGGWGHRFHGSPVVISPFFGFGFGRYPYYPYYPYYPPVAPVVPYYSEPVQRYNTYNTYVVPDQTTTSKYEVQPVPPDTQSTRITVVLKNGQKIDAPGYALVGPTLWVLDSNNATPYSLSDIDTAATREENLKHGVDLTVPAH